MAAMALLGAGIDPEERVYCGGGYQLGNRFFRCLGRHGSMTMHTAIARSCNTYFYSMGNRIGYDAIAVMARRLRSEEHTSELQSLMRISYAVFCLKKKKKQ